MTKRTKQITSQLKEEKEVGLLSFFSNRTVLLTAWFVCITTLYTLLRDSKKMVGDATWRSGKVALLDKTNTIGLVRGVFTTIGTIFAIWFYYSFLVRTMELDENIAFHIFNAVSFLSFAIWHWLYFVDRNRIHTVQPLLTRLLGEENVLFSYMSPSVRAFFDNLPTGVFIAISEVVPQMHLSLFWSYMNRVLKHIEKDDDSGKDIYKSIIIYNVYSQTAACLPTMLAILVGVSYKTLATISLYYIYISLVVFSIARFLVDSQFASNNLYVRDTEGKKDRDSNTMINSIVMIWSNEILRNIFIANIAYFTLNSMVDNIAGSFISEFANQQALNLSMIFGHVGKKDLVSNIKSFMNTAVNLGTAVFTSLIETSENRNALNGSSAFLNKLSVDLVSLTSAFLFLISFFYAYVIRRKVDWFLVILGFLSLSFSRTIKYMLIDPIRYRIFSKIKKESERELGKSAVDIYSTRMVKSLFPIIVNNSIEGAFYFYGSSVDYVYYGAPFYLALCLPLYYVWNDSVAKINEYEDK